jgi:hypothetical protein
MVSGDSVTQQYETPKKNPAGETEASKPRFIPDSKIRAQAWKFYFVIIAWPAYFFVLPFIFEQFGAWSLVFMIFPGLYIFTWVGFLMHEAWHKYVPNIPSDGLYYVLAFMLLTDPQVYKMLHGFHHSMVHTWDDTEFHPAGYIKSHTKRQLYNIAEVFLGIAFLSGVAAAVVPKHPRFKARYKRWKAAASLPVILAFIGSIAFASHMYFGVPFLTIVLSYLISIWIHSVLLHQSQLVEHGNIIVEGDFNSRNIWTHNLSDKKIPEKTFLFLTHGDSREHVLHHTIVSVYSRPFPHKVPMPPESVYITLKDHLGVLKQMLKGEVTPIKTELRSGSSAPGYQAAEHTIEHENGKPISI